MSVAYGFRTPSVRDVVSAEEWKIRVELAAFYRLIAMYGWDDIIFTHISARVPGADHHFLINPYGLMFEEITASSLIKVDLDGNKIIDSEHPVNVAGFVIHSALHRASEEAQCVVHLHTDDGVAVSAQEHGLLPLTQHAMNIWWDVAYHDYEGIAVDFDEQERLVRDLGSKHIMILRNHGTLAVGDCCASTFSRIYFLERASTMQVRALAGRINQPPQGIPQKVAEQIAMMRADPNNIDAHRQLYWTALLRKLDRMDPSYKS
jgi:ribulose-5-phosphate 4-epimerase/fuculose-1-phosphate aldolase